MIELLAIICPLAIGALLIVVSELHTLTVKLENYEQLIDITVGLTD